MSRAVAELKQIPFSQLIGGPLKAAIEAQALAAQSTIEFIQKVGFVEKPAQSDLLFQNPEKDADAGDLRYVKFRYAKKGLSNDETYELTVPLLTIVPIPYIRIEEVTIDFKAKLTDMIERQTTNQTEVQVATSGKFAPFWSPVKFDLRASATTKSNNSSRASEQREYSLDIHVRATQDAMPAGLSKILDMLEDAIKDRPTANPQLPG